MNEGDREAIAVLKQCVEDGFTSTNGRLKVIEKHLIHGNGQKSLLVRAAEVESAILELKRLHDERQSRAEKAANRRATIISSIIGALAVLLSTWETWWP